MSAGPPDPLAGFDATIHAPNRLRICALLDAAGEAEFVLVQKQLDVSASVLSKHVTVLMDADMSSSARPCATPGNGCGSA